MLSRKSFKISPEIGLLTYKHSKLQNLPRRSHCSPLLCPHTPLSVAGAIGTNCSSIARIVLKPKISNVKTNLSGT